jgi:hypothetical protein
MIRYILPLLILRQILGLFGHFKIHEGPLVTPNQYFLLCVCSPSCYLPIPCQLRLKDFVHGVEISKSSFYSQIMLIPGPLGPRGLAVTEGHHIIFPWAQVDCPWPEPYKSRYPCHLENLYLFWNSDLFLEHWLGFNANIAILQQFYARYGAWRPGCKN